MKRILLIGIVLIASLSGLAQQQAMFTQYMFNGLALNPAYAGSHESISLTALARYQWVGLEGAPRTQTVSVHSPIPGKSLALGLLISNDELGVSDNTSLLFSGAYRIKMSSGTLSMGLQAGLANAQINYEELGLNDPNQSGVLKQFNPNFGGGVYYYSERFYAGVSVPYLVNTKIKGSGLNELQADQIRHYFLTSGVVFDLSRVLKLKPSILVKVVEGAPVETDFNAMLLLDERIWFGISYRSFDAMNFIIDLQVNPRFRFGYSYDYTLTDLQQVNSGSHEFMVNYRFVFAKKKIITPRYF